MICGIDEAGRGPLAGPVVAAAVLFKGSAPEGLADSKKLSAKKRAQLHDELVAGGHFIGVGIAEPGEIDAINILQATFLAMRRAVANLCTPTQAEVIVDGHILPQLGLPSGVRARSLVKADVTVPEVSAASIVAKHTRDTLMKEYDKLYPEYGFIRHQGYGVPAHLEALRLHGPCPIHRISFSPVKESISQFGNKLR